MPKQLRQNTTTTAILTITIESTETTVKELAVAMAVAATRKATKKFSRRK